MIAPAHNIVPKLGLILIFFFLLITSIASILFYLIINLFTYVLDNGCHESVGAYKCSNLENTYPGINKIYKISNDGKLPRVGISSVKNKKYFMLCL